MIGADGMLPRMRYLYCTDQGDRGLLELSPRRQRHRLQRSAGSFLGAELTFIHGLVRYCSYYWLTGVITVAWTHLGGGGILPRP